MGVVQQGTAFSSFFIVSVMSGAPRRFSGRFEDGKFKLEDKDEDSFGPILRMKMWRTHISLMLKNIDYIRSQTCLR